MEQVTLGITAQSYSRVHTDNRVYDLDVGSGHPNDVTAIKCSFVRASVVVQWLRICLPMQGTRVRALVWEDPTCRRAARPVSHNY